MTTRQGTPVAALFQGYDTFTSSGMNTAVNGTSTSTGGTETCTITTCTTYSDYQQALNISASASAVYGGVSADAAASFFQSLNISTYTVTVIVYSSTYTSKSFSNVSLNNNVSVSTSTLDQFCADYGDSYISEVQQGGQYMAAYVFYAQSEEEQTSVQTQLSGYGVSGAATTQAALTEATTNITTSQYFTQQVTGFTDLTLPAADDVISFAENFAGLTPNAPVVISYTTQGYENVVGETTFAPVVTNRNLFLNTLSPDYGTLSAVNNQIAAINAIYNTYGYTGDTQLNANTSGTKAYQVNTDLNSLETLIQQINQNPAGTFQAGTYPSLSYGSPQLNFSCPIPPNTPAWGETGGGVFQDITSTQQILEQWIPQSLQLRGGEYVNQIICTYSSVQNQEPMTTTYSHGGTGGGLGDILSLAPATPGATPAFITSISGGCGEYVNQLVFSTNTGEKLTGGSSGGGSFSWNVPAGSVLVGFQGYAGEYLNQLQPVVCTFSPATWSGSTTT